MNMKRLLAALSLALLVASMLAPSSSRREGLLARPDQKAGRLGVFGLPVVVGTGRASDQRDARLPGLHASDAPRLDARGVEGTRDVVDLGLGNRGEQPARGLRIVGERDELGSDSVRRPRAPAARTGGCAPRPRSPRRPRPAPARPAGPATRPPRTRTGCRTPGPSRSPWPSSPKPGHVRRGPDTVRRRGPRTPRGSGSASARWPSPGRPRRSSGPGAIPRPGHRSRVAWSGSARRPAGRHPCAAACPDGPPR